MSNIEKWYAAKVGTQWYIQSGPGTVDPDVLSSAWVGEEQAKRNAILCSQAPEWRELCRDMYIWMEMYMEESPTIDTTHPIHSMLNQYRELEKR